MITRLFAKHLAILVKLQIRALQKCLLSCEPCFRKHSNWNRRKFARHVSRKRSNVFFVFCCLSRSFREGWRFVRSRIRVRISSCMQSSNVVQRHCDRRTRSVAVAITHPMLPAIWQTRPLHSASHQSRCGALVERLRYLTIKCSQVLRSTVLSEVLCCCLAKQVWTLLSSQAHEVCAAGNADSWVALTCTCASVSQRYSAHPSVIRKPIFSCCSFHLVLVPLIVAFHIPFTNKITERNTVWNQTWVITSYCVSAVISFLGFQFLSICPKLYLLWNRLC